MPLMPLIFRLPSFHCGIHIFTLSSRTSPCSTPSWLSSIQQKFCMFFGFNPSQPLSHKAATQVSLFCRMRGIFDLPMLAGLGFLCAIAVKDMGNVSEKLSVPLSGVGLFIFSWGDDGEMESGGKTTVLGTIDGDGENTNHTQGGFITSSHSKLFQTSFRIRPLSTRSHRCVDLSLVLRPPHAPFLPKP